MYTQIPATFAVSCDVFNEVTGEQVPSGEVTITQDTSSGSLVYRFAFDGMVGGPWSIDKHEVEEMYVAHIVAHIADNTTVTVSDDAFFAYQGIHVFSFGAYGCTHVLAFGRLEDALENAAECLQPGMFTELDHEQARAELFDAGDLDSEQVKDYDSDEVADMVHEHATMDLTYTESGYIASWEWTVVTFHTLEEAQKFCEALTD